MRASPRAIAAAFVLLAGIARAESPSPNEVAPIDSAEAPYTEGWHGAGQPGEHALGRASLWNPLHSSDFEFGKRRPRVGTISKQDLGHASSVYVLSVGVEASNARTGWLSFDYWSIGTSALVELAQAHTVNDTTFLQGQRVRSVISQHFMKLRDGAEARYRVPLGEEVHLDLVMGPIIVLAMRYESLDVRAGIAQDGSHLFAVSLVPGVRLGIDFQVGDFTARAGVDLEYLPRLTHAPFSFTREPTITAWADALVFVALRFSFVEISIGYRHFETDAKGGRVREARTVMDGFTFGVAARF